jgi:chromosome segregation protein
MPPRLKSLELHGYKTFASKTLFEFPGMITAVVGPNGSGKSNIADSMRWVLGEQSYGLLRGRKTEDMIFAGSELRTRAGMASATITFDNADDWLPIDFSEVTITRRAYRDGTNEYLLNGQRVRLREISELLAQSGLAERTYTIIGQGLVDSALSLKPEERRRLFEEAAGIGLYRARREESLNRLEATRRNLERVQDILSELEPRLQNLERQARRAQEYEHVRADLQLLLRDWYGYHWHRAEKELHQVREVLHGQELKLEQAKQDQEEAGRRVVEHRGFIQEIRTQLNAWHTAASQFHSAEEKLNRDLAILEERQRALQAQSHAAQGDLARHEEELKVRKDRLQLALDDVERVKADLEEADAQESAARKKLLQRQVERTKADQALRDARQSQTSAETRLVQLKAHLSELTSRQETQRKGLETALQAVESGQLALQKAQEALSQAESERKQIQEALEAARAAVQEHQKQAAALETARKRQADQLAQQDAERARLKVQLDVLEQAERSLAGYSNGAKYLVQSAQQGKVKGKLQTFRSALEVPEELETAVAAALGDALDVILVEENHDPESLLDLLANSDKGRAAFFPVEDVLSGGNMAFDADGDCLGVAADLITCPVTMQPILRALLGNILIVRSRSAGRKWQKRLNGSGVVVTLKGELFLANGTIIGGKENRSGALSRPRQKKEMQESIDLMDANLKALREELARMDDEIRRSRDAEAGLEADLRAIGQKLDKVRERYQQATLVYEQAKRQQDWQTNQRANLDGQIRKTDEEIKRTTEETSKLDTRIQAAAEQVRQCKAALAALPMDELQAQVNHWNTAAAVADRALKDADTRLEEVQTSITREAQQIQNLNQRIDELDKGSSTIEVDRVALKEQEHETATKLDELQKQIEPAEQKLETLESEYITLQQVESSAQQATNIAERHFTQAQLEMTRQKDAFENLRRRIEEDFGLVAFEYTTDMAGPNPLPLDGMVEQLPVITELPADIEENISRQRGQLRRMGAINPDAQSEYLAVKDRHDFMVDQCADLKKADADLRQVISELDELMKRDFKKTFDAVAVEFKSMFTRLFGGGSARLVMTDEDNPTDTGIDIEARLPGRREQGLSLLSGGERCLTAVALVFSLLKVAPTPFCVMDEVDAMLDEANVGRFRDLLVELSQNTQFIIITHNRNTVQAADVIYGITMGRDSASQMISLKLDDISDDMVR